MKVLRQKYDTNKQALKDLTYFAEDQDPDIEMEESDLDEQDLEKEVGTDDEDLYSSGDEDKK